MNQIEFLLRLSEDARDEGDQLTKEQDKVYSEHTKKLVELSRMIELAKHNIDRELDRFRRWVPQEGQAQLPNRHQPPQQQEMPRVVTKPVNG